MKPWLLVLFILAFAVSAIADTNGVEILPWSSSGGAASGVVEVYPDGTAIIKGQIQGVPFISSGTVAQNPGGGWTFTSLYSDGDLLCRQKTWIPLSINYTGDEEDALDGDATDDDVGTLEVRSQSGMGTGSVQLQG